MSVHGCLPSTAKQEAGGKSGQGLELGEPLCEILMDPDQRERFESSVVHVKKKRWQLQFLLR